jgi:hypothetical protein
MLKRPSKDDILVILVALIPVFAGAIWTSQDRIWGYDGNFYLSFMFNHSPLVANLCVIAVWEAIFCTLLRFGNQPIAALFMLNMTNIRLLMPDPDVFIFFLCSFTFLGFVYQRFGKVAMSYLAILLTLSIFLFWRIPLPMSGAYGDLLSNPILFMAILPTYYIQLKQKQYIDALILTWIIVLFPTGKFVMIAMMPLIFAVFLRAIDRAKTESLKIGTIGIMLIVFSLVAFFMFPLMF